MSKNQTEEKKENHHTHIHFIFIKIKSLWDIIPQKRPTLTKNLNDKENIYDMDQVTSAK